ncbi:Velvet factor [Penicillium expansum]|uniref:Developmental and secondary metabolism regulator veA n=1 Tax=Penicillium expansum TaxID=27334 RepID=A0A0A2IN48_PENEN|nr:Velvet factor [Penicillium expansum]KGO43906.1 Velvet factor [Penicillium expansum]KGO63018.1 Velvet factor [Penicillium expansum]
MANRPPIMPPHNETEHSVSRITREGKQLTYKLSVMQQPERARACGAGAKSSADRRPVDPPPVVELRIFESDPANDAQKTDITFAYNANFFLYATLDTARPIAHGRVGGPQSCPVLTGVPVAGVAYLDRPSQAGYFIFPDLSVRHEGRYRLNFHLYEEIKEAKDADKDSPLPLPNQIPLSATSKPGVPQAFLHFRLEVKSVPFTVYSAKKFPGLATSTSLSRIIAEQGCRVRIRRDVRMRRRGDKRDTDYEFGEERAAAYAAGSSDRFTTPDRYAASMDRPRSNSNGSNVESPYGFVPPDRRPSAPDYGFQCPQPYQRPMPPAPLPHSSQTPSYQSHLSFGSTPSHYPAPHMPPTPPPPAVSQGIYSPQHAYAQIRHPSNGSEYEGTPISYPVAPQIPPERGGYPKSMNAYGMEPPKPNSYMDPRMAEPGLYQSIPHVPVSRSQTPNLVQATPPYKPLSNEYANHIVPSVESTSPGGGGGYDNVRGKRMVYQTGPGYGKRSHEDTFGLDDRSMQNGMRPDTDPYPAYRDFSGESRAALMAEMGIELAYKRANGKMVMKVPPSS